MTADGVMVGEIAHIEGALPTSARFNPDMTNEQRRGYDNLLLMCGTDHTVIDNDAEAWTVARLRALKRAHEANATAVGQSPRDIKASARVLPIDAMVADSPPFVGRELQLQDVAANLNAAGDPRRSLVAVSGPPGVGKTTLLRQAVAAAQAADLFQYVLFVDMRGYEEDPANRVHADAVFHPLLSSFGLDDDDIPQDPADQARKYQEVMNQFAAEGKSVLLWLDNVSERDQFDSLRPANPVHKVTITTRETFGHIPSRQVVEVKRMPLDEAVTVITTSARDRNPDDHRFDSVDQVERLAVLCDRLPLALQIVAALLADEPDRPIEELVVELAREEDRLGGLHYSGDLSVRAALALSYNRLPEELRRLFRLLSVVPGGDVGLDAAAILIRASSGPAARQQLMALVRSHLVEQHVPNRWSMHDLVRLYSTEECASQAGDAETAFQRLVGRYYVALAGSAEWLTAVVSDKSKILFPSAEDAAAWFQAERATATSILTRIVAREDFRAYAIGMGVVLGELLRQQKHWVQEFHDVAALTASLAPKVREQNPWIASCALNNYGSALRMLGDFDGAVRVYEQAIEINQARGDVAALSLSRCNIANVYFDQGRVDDAFEVYWQDVRISRESEPPHLSNEAGTLNNIGAALAKRERFEEAVAPLRQSLTIRRRLDDQPGIADTSLNLGAALSRLALLKNGQTRFVLLEEACALLEVAFKIFGARGNQSGQAEVANNLGQSQCLLGRYAEGFRNLEIAINYFDTSGQRDLAALVRDDLHRYQRQAGLN
ncbi:putative ATPase [Mycobacterium lentiflavum]|nr:tetratricopeptide repeat protein [Mycobacterium lentiflavum]MEE3064990.1 tetratricopeptide repeat protein [Actinomycetota bacterium]ULP45519.1 tetratricopeptide repeat protein [Mycobacterium lentiflavum]CQD24774.1 putative ATPase [Mycobacterium lentiflavum]